MREKAEELEENMVDVRRVDKTIRPFEIPVQSDVGGDILKIGSYQVIEDGEPVIREADITL
jgi:hypothetical protein